MYLQSGTYIYMPYDTRCHMAWANIVNPSSAMICNDNHGSQDYRDVPSFFLPLQAQAISQIKAQWDKSYTSRLGYALP